MAFRGAAILTMVVLALTLSGPAPAFVHDAGTPEAPPGLSHLIADGGVYIDRPAPDPRGGKAYRMVYRVPATLDVFWQFKTDFDNDFLVSNPLITAHRLVRREGGAVITENRYARAPEDLFRWETRPDAVRRVLSFRLLNAENCGQRFHYGTISLFPDGETTLVVQIAYFDFFGAGLWARYPWAGGMTHFLTTTARWEQETLARLRGRYPTGNDGGRRQGD